MANVRHVVVVRKDLNMTEGLLSAQVAHISDMFMRERINQLNSVEAVTEAFTEDELAWMKEPYITVLAVDNLEELNEVAKDGKEAGLEVYEWIDLIPSKNLNRPIPNVKVGISFTPTDSDKLKAITGTLPLA